MARERKTSELKSFSYLENGKVLYSNIDTVKSTSVLDAGYYRLDWLPYPKETVEMTKLENTENLPIYEFIHRDKIEVLVNSFFSKEKIAIVKELGFINKLGILLYGIEGTGKSSIVKYYCNNFIKKDNAIVFYININYQYSESLDRIWDFMIQVRKVQNNPIVIVFDEVEIVCEEKESEFKTMLDGHLSINDSIVLATTNYFDKIPDTIKNRPSRFKYCFNIDGVQDEKTIIDIINNTFPSKFSEEERKQIALDMKGNTLDIIKHHCLDKLFDIQLDYKKESKIGFKNK